MGTNSIFNLDLNAQIFLAVIGTYWLHSTLLIGGTWLVTVLLRLRDCAHMERLWKFAAVAPLMTSPLALSIGFSLPGTNLSWLLPAERLNEGHRSWSAQADSHSGENSAVADGWRLSIQTKGTASGRSSTLDTQSPRKGVDADALNEVRSQRESANNRFIQDRLATKSASRGDHVGKFAHIVSLGLGAVVLLGMGRLCLQGVRLCHWLRRCRRIDERQQRLLDQIGHRFANGNQILLLESSTLTEPIACGWLRWRIVLPTGCAGRLTEREWMGMLTHEVAHLVRGDTWWLLIGELLCGCLPFQPLNFLARRRWSAAAEVLCDEWTVLRTNDPFSLASCLTRIAEWKLDVELWKRSLVSSISGSSVAKRVDRLLSDRRNDDKHLWRHLWCLRLVGISSVLGMTLISPLSRAQTHPRNDFDVPPNVAKPQRNRRADGRHPSDGPGANAPRLANDAHTGIVRKTAVSVPAASHVEQSEETNSHTDPITSELVELEVELSRCADLATHSQNEEVLLLAELLRERARLLTKLWNDHP